MKSLTIVTRIDEMITGAERAGGVAHVTREEES